MLILFGIVVVVLGLGLLVADKLGFGKLPGDLVVRRKNVTVYVPIVSSIVLSIVLTLLLNFWLGRK